MNEDEKKEKITKFMRKVQSDFIEFNKEMDDDCDFMMEIYSNSMKLGKTIGYGCPACSVDRIIKRNWKHTKGSNPQVH